MKSKIKIFSNICFWLSIIAILLFVGVVLFATYLYKVNIISLIELVILYNILELLFKNKKRVD